MDPLRGHGDEKNETGRKIVFPPTSYYYLSFTFQHKTLLLLFSFSGCAHINTKTDLYNLKKYIVLAQQKY